MYFYLINLKIKFKINQFYTGVKMVDIVSRKYFVKILSCICHTKQLKKKTLMTMKIINMEKYIVIYCNENH